MRLKRGQSAPLFDATDRYGRRVSLVGVARSALTRGRERAEAASKGIGIRVRENLFPTDGRFARMSAEFLLDPDWRVHTVYYGHDAGDFLLFSEIDAFLGETA